MPSTYATKKRKLRQRHEAQLRERLRALESTTDTDFGSDMENETTRRKARGKNYCAEAQTEVQDVPAELPAKKRKIAAANTDDLNSSSCSLEPIASDVGAAENCAAVMISDDGLRPASDFGGDGTPPPEDRARKADEVPAVGMSDTGDPCTAGVWLGADDTDDDYLSAEEDLIPQEVALQDLDCFQPLDQDQDPVDESHEEDAVQCATDEDLVIVSDHEADGNEEQEMMHAVASDDEDSDHGEAVTPLHAEADGTAEAPTRDKPVYYGPEDISLAKRMKLFGQELVSAFCQHDISIEGAEHINEVYADYFPLLARFVKETGRRLPHFKSHRATCITKIPKIEISTAHRRVDDPSREVVIETTTGLSTYSNTFADREKYKRLWLQCKIKVNFEWFRIPLTTFEGQPSTK